MADTFYSWFLVTELHVWMAMTRYMAEGKNGKAIRNYIVTAMWEDTNARVEKLGVSVIIFNYVNYMFLYIIYILFILFCFVCTCNVLIICELIMSFIIPDYYYYYYRASVANLRINKSKIYQINSMLL